LPFWWQKNRWNSHYAQLTASGIMIGLHPTNESNIQRNSGNLSIGFTTEDFENTKIQLTKIGVSITERTEEGGDFHHFKDPDGTFLYFIQPKW
jgi:predicted enzyme related to lactoylglutathione lyase